MRVDCLRGFRQGNTLLPTLRPIHPGERLVPWDRYRQTDTSLELPGEIEAQARFLGERESATHHANGGKAEQLNPNRLLQFQVERGLLGLTTIRRLGLSALIVARDAADLWCLRRMRPLTGLPEAWLRLL